MIKRTNADAIVSEFAYDHRGNTTMVRVWNKTYTPTGQPDIDTDPDGGTIDIDYDPVDRPEYQRQSVGGGSPTRVTRTEYDAAGQPLRVYKAWGTTDQITYSTQTYDADGRVLTLKDANQNLTNYTYDGYGRLSRLTFPDGSYETYAYDNNGNIYQKRSRSGYTISTSFDALNREIGRSVVDNPNYPGSYSRSYVINFDLASRKWNVGTGTLGLHHRYDTAGRLVRVIDTSLNSLGSSIGNVEYGYDGSGNRNAMTFYSSQGAMTINYEFDTGERLWRVTQSGSVLAQYNYDPMSRLKSLAYLDSTSVAYEYEADDDLQSITHAYNGGSLSLGYTHNGAHQLRTLTVSNPNYLMKQPSPALSYAPNNLNQYTAVGTASLSYDPNGNLISDGLWSYRYDEENFLRQAVSSSTTVDYSYDALGRRRAKTVNGVVTYFINDGANELAELSSTGSRLRVYVTGRAIDDHVAMRDDVAGSGWQFFHANHQGSSLFTTSAAVAGAVAQTFRYDAYGKEYSTDPATGNPFRFAGRYLDAETGLYYNRARYYSASLGRFLQVDPIGYGDDLNLYAYVKNDPLNATDPTGRCEARTGTRICDVYGTPQKTGTQGHDTASAKIGQKMVDSGEYKSVHYNQAQSTVTGDTAAGRQRADVAGVTHEGQVDTVEIASKSQSVAKMNAKGAEMQGKMQPSMRGEHSSVTVSEAMAGKGIPRAGTALGVAGAVVGLPGALLARKENPNMSTAEFLARAFGVYEIAVANGDLPPPPPTY